MAKEAVKNRISFRLGLELTLVAVVCDLIGLIPLTEDVIVVLFWVGTTYVLRKHGVPILNGKKLATMLIDIFIGLWPALQALPEITLGILLIIAMVYAEDKTGLKFTKGGKIINKDQLISSVTPQIESVANYLNKDGVRQPTPKAPPLNEGGVRQPTEGARSEAGNVIKMDDIRARHEPLDLAA